MSEPPLEPMEPELAALLDAERHAVAPAAALDRVRSRLVLGTPPGGGGEGQAAGAGRAGGQGWLASHAVPVAACAFVAGTVAGAAGYAALRATPPAHVVYVDRPVPSPSVPASAGPRVLPQAVASSPAASAVPSDHLAARPAPSSVSSSSSSSLAAERALLDDARAALASGEPGRALSLVDEHARRFPRAQLWEEREALAIQALVLTQRYDEARARAARFRSLAPSSLFLPAIDASLASIP